MSNHDPLVCLHSTPATVRNGVFSVCAAMETVVSVVCYFALGLWTTNYTFLLTSIVVAPLLLLRSSASRALGVRMFLSETPVPATGLRLWLMLVTVFVVATMSAMAFWRLVPTSDSLYQCLIAIAMAMAGFILGLSAGGTVLVVLFGSPAVAAHLARLRPFAELLLGVRLPLASPTSGSAPVSRANKRTESLGFLAAALGCVVGCLVVGSSWLQVGVVVITLLVCVTVALQLLFGLTAGIALMTSSWAVRCLATLRFPCRGLAALPDNWYRVAFLEDVFQPPELLPGVAREAPGLGFAGIWRAPTQQYGPFVQWVFRPLLLLLYILLPLAYRVTLKSTSWLYLPLAYVVIPVRHTTARVALGLRRTLLEKMRLLLAVVTILALAAKTFDLIAWNAIRESDPVGAIAYFWAIDLKALRLWDWLSMTSACITVALYFWADHLLALNPAAPMAPQQAPPLPRSVMLLIRLRQLSTAAFLLISFVFAVLLFSSVEDHLPEWCIRFLEWLFQRRLPIP